MAIGKYDEIITKEYQPLTMQELAMAPAYLRQQHDKMDELAIKEAMANSQRLQEDDEAVNNYWNNYRTNINTISDELGNKGFTRDLARKLRSIKQQKEMDMQGGLPGVAQANYQAYLKNVEEEKKRLDKGDITQEQFNRGIKRARELYGQQGAAAKGARYNPYSAANYVDIEKRMIEMGKNMTPQEIIAQNPNLVPSGHGYYVSKTTGRKYMPAEAIRETLMGLVINDPNINAYLNDVYSLGLLGNRRDENGNIRSMTPQEHLFQKANAVGQLLQRNDISETYKHMTSPQEDYAWKLNYKKKFDEENKPNLPNIPVSVGNALNVGAKGFNWTDGAIAKELDKTIPTHKLLIDGQIISKDFFISRMLDAMEDDPDFAKEVIETKKFGLDQDINNINIEKLKKTLGHAFDAYSRKQKTTGTAEDFLMGGEELYPSYLLRKIGIVTERYSPEEMKEIRAAAENVIKSARKAATKNFNLINGTNLTESAYGDLYGNKNKELVYIPFYEASAVGGETINQDLTEFVQSGNISALTRMGAWVVDNDSKQRLGELADNKELLKLFESAKKGDISVTPTRASIGGGINGVDVTIKGKKTISIYAPDGLRGNDSFHDEINLFNYMQNREIDGVPLGDIFDPNFESSILKDKFLMIIPDKKTGTMTAQIPNFIKKDPNNPNSILIKKDPNSNQWVRLDNVRIENTQEGINIYQYNPETRREYPNPIFINYEMYRTGKDDNLLPIYDYMYEMIHPSEKARTKSKYGQKFPDVYDPELDPWSTTTSSSYSESITSTIPSSLHDGINPFDNNE